MATKLTSVIVDQINAVNALDTNAVAATIAEDKRLPREIVGITCASALRPGADKIQRVAAHQVNSAAKSTRAAPTDKRIRYTAYLPQSRRYSSYRNSHGQPTGPPRARSRQFPDVDNPHAKSQRT